MQSVGSGSPLPRSRVRNVRGGSVGLIGVAVGGLISAWRGVCGGIGAATAGIAGLFSRGRGGTYGGRSSGSGVSGVLGKVAEPVQLSLSRGVLALLAVVVVALLGLMFQAGQHMAGRGGPETGEIAAGQPSNTPEGPGNAADTSQIVQVPVEDGTGEATATLPIEPREAVGGAVDVTVQPAPVDIPRYDPRAPGRAYLILATVRPSQIDGIRKLQQFMADNRVATYLDTTNNGRFRVLVDVSRGFTVEEQRSGLTLDHKRKMMLLGQKWKQFNQNRGTDLSDMYWDLYHGPGDTN